MLKNVLGLFLGSLFALLILSGSAYSAPPSLGQVAPEFAGKSLTGKDVSPSSLNSEGKFVMLDFWASWCGPCMVELPNVVELYKNFRSDKFEILSVSLDTEDTLEKLNEVITSYGIDYPVIYEGGGWETRLAKEWGVRAIPATFLVSPDGRIVLRNIRGEEGLELVKRIVDSATPFEVPDFNLEFSADESWSGVSAKLAMPALKGEEKFAFSFYYVALKEEGEDARDYGGDFIVSLNPQKSGEILVSVEPMEQEGVEAQPAEHHPVNVNYAQEGDNAVLTFTFQFAELPAYAYASVDYYSPALGKFLNVSYDYVRKPKEDSEV